MPNGIYPIPPIHPLPPIQPREGHDSDHGARLALRLFTRWNRRPLDDELARGTDPRTGAALALRAALELRAAQLRSPEVRARLANRLVEALGDARAPNLEPLTARGRRQRAAVEASRDDLLALVMRLRDERPVDVRGVAMVAQLVSAGIGRRKQHAGEQLRHAVRAARFALDPTGVSDHSIEKAA